MNATETPLWYSPIGNTAYSRLEQRDDELRILTGETKDGFKKVTGIMRIRRDKRYLDKFSIHVTLFHKGGSDDLHRSANSNALRLMFDTSQNTKPHDNSIFVEIFEADFGEEGLFIRKGPYVCFPNPGHKLSRDPRFCFEVKKYMKEAVARLIKTGKIR